MDQATRSTVVESSPMGPYKDDAKVNSYQFGKSGTVNSDTSLSAHFTAMTSLTSPSFCFHLPEYAW